MPKRRLNLDGIYHSKFYVLSLKRLYTFELLTFTLCASGSLGVAVTKVGFKLKAAVEIR
jgi:hypothetical protein